MVRKRLLSGEGIESGKQMNPCILLSFNEGYNSPDCIDKALESFFDTKAHIVMCSFFKLTPLIGRTVFCVG